jgi:thiamine kinase-like enzyme
LERALSPSREKPIRIRALHREVCEHISSFHAEHLRVSLDSGESIPVFFKDLNPEHQLDTAQKVRAGDLGASNQELCVYRQILSRVDLGTPQLYAVRWEPDSGMYWIFLEDVGTSRLRDSRNYLRWVPAARWVARFHAFTREMPSSQTSFLPVWDVAHYERCAERVRGTLGELSASDRTLVNDALEYYVRRIDWFAALPKTVIHGQFFGKNIMLRRGRGERTLAVIDWETAALGPGGFDLVSVSSGRWTGEQRQAMWRAYFDEYQACTGLSLTWESFCREIRELEIYQALEWLGWWRNRNVSHNFGRWIKELERILIDHPRSAFEVRQHSATRQF